MNALDPPLSQPPALSRAPVRPWEATVFLRWLCSTGMSRGELLAGLLNAWSASTDRKAKAQKAGLPSPGAARRFDVAETATVWYAAHLQALHAWLAVPVKVP